MNTTTWPAVLRPFLTLSYPTNTPKDADSFADSPYYTTGPLDLCIVVTWILIFAILRDSLRLGILEPLARWKLYKDLAEKRERGGDSKEAKGLNGNGAALASTPKASRREIRRIERNVTRFAEQGWSFVYYTLQWAQGLVHIHSNLPTEFLDPRNVWAGYPHIPIAGPLKIYYLTQNAFYIHQVLVLNAEALRKDHYQMMAHHFITIVLMGLSYFMHFTRVGSLIMVLMDCCDIFFPLAKMLRYLNYSRLCDAMFTVFLVSWFVTRHILYNITIYSTYYDAPRYIPFAWSSETGHYWSRNTWIMFTSMLGSLQVLQLVWFWMICRVAYRVITGQGADDSRSDDEDEGETSDALLKEQ